MAEPKTEIDRRFDRIELAIGTMASWLVQAQTGFGAKDAEGIDEILRGEKDDWLSKNKAEGENKGD